jgi:hypothetical protein
VEAAAQALPGPLRQAAPVPALCLHLVAQGFLLVAVVVADMPVQVAALERVAERPDKTRSKQLAAKAERKVALALPVLEVAALVLRAVAAMAALVPVIVESPQPAEVVSELAVRVCLTQEMPGQAVAVVATLVAAAVAVILVDQAVAAAPGISTQVL